MQDIRPVDLSAYATAADLASVALLVDGKIDLAGDTGIGNLRLGNNSTNPPVGALTRYLIIGGETYGVGQVGGLVLQGFNSGTASAGEILFTAGTKQYGRIKSLITDAVSNAETGTLTFYVTAAGTEVTGMTISGAGIVNFGGNTGTAAAAVTCSNFSFSGVSYPVIVQNLGNSTGGTGIVFVGASSTGAILSTGRVYVRKTALTSTTSTADLVVELPNASATPTEVMRVKAGGGVISSYRSGASDPTTSDVPAGFCVDWLNTTSGELRRWANVAGTMRKSAAMT